MEVKININSYIQIFKVIFKKSPPIVEGNKINLKYYPKRIPLYIYQIEDNNKSNLIQINNDNIRKDPNTNIYVTPYDIND